MDQRLRECVGEGPAPFDEEQHQEDCLFIRPIDYRFISANMVLTSPAALFHTVIMNSSCPLARLYHY